MKISKSALLVVWTLIAALISSAPSHASGAGFIVSAQGIELGEPEEVVENNAAQPPRYATKIEQGQTFTILAQGRAYPRYQPTGDAETDAKAAKGSPMKPGAATWRFDDEDFKSIEPDEKEFDESFSVLRLQAQTIGRTRIRFNGTILGYKRTFDVLVDIIAPAPK